MSHKIDQYSVDLCVVCGSQGVNRFVKYLGNQETIYAECILCGHLTANQILKEPTYENKYFQDIDTGWQERNARVMAFLQLLTIIPGIRLGSRATEVDYGCGEGTLVEQLTQWGINAYGYEPYVHSSLVSNHVYSDWNNLAKTVRKTELVTCIEVLEHIRYVDDTINIIKSLLAPDGYLLISTKTYKKGVHKEAWYYLNPAAGHVPIFAEVSVKIILARHGFHPVIRINDSMWLFRLESNR